MKVVVIGAGISGLAAAWEVHRIRPDAEVLVLESSGEVGGKLRTGQIAGHPVDLGAESMLTRNPIGTELIGQLGLTDQLIAPLTLSAGVRAGGVTHRLPANTMFGIPTDVDAARDSGLFSSDTLARIEAEPSQPGLNPLEHDISVGALVRMRLGSEVVDSLVEPLLGGVYAGRADKISLAAAMPALSSRLNRDGGSLVEAARFALADGRNAGSGDGPVFVSLAGGIGSLPTALAQAGAFEVRTNVTVRGISRGGASGFLVNCGATNAVELIDADAIIVATPAGKSAVLLRDVCRAASRELATVEAASVAIVTLAFRADALQGGTGLPGGSGLLIAADEGFSIKATTFTSQKWPGFPAGLVVLRASLGRIGETTVLQREDAELVRLVRSDLARLIGLTSTPVDSLVSRWAGALPQYEVGHLDKVARIRAALDGVNGIEACGAVFDGVGIPSCIASAQRAVARLSLTFDNGGQ